MAKTIAELGRSRGADKYSPMGISDNKRDGESGGVSPPPLRAGRPPVPRWLILYFSALITLTIVALIPGSITIGFLFIVIPGLVFLASPTPLYYSVALLPSYVVNRLVGRPFLASLVAMVGLASAALLPRYTSRLESVVAAKTTLAITYPTRPFYFGYVHC
jgi:hypothetical protein